MGDLIQSLGIGCAYGTLNSYAKAELDCQMIIVCAIATSRQAIMSKLVIGMFGCFVC
jgi:hypothetical protein